jgi:hypothetical protein
LTLKSKKSQESRLSLDCQGWLILHSSAKKTLSVSRARGSFLFVGQVEKEQESLKVEEGRLDAESKRLDAEERRYWKEYNEYQLELGDVLEEVRARVCVRVCVCVCMCGHAS